MNQRNSHKKNEFDFNPMKGLNDLLVKSQIELMNKYAALGEYHIAIIYRDMIWNCETFFGRYPEDAKFSINPKSFSNGTLIYK